MIKRLMLLGTLLCFGCSAPAVQVPQENKQQEKAPDLSELIRSLKNLNSKSSAGQVLLVFNALLSKTAESYPDGLQINSYAYDKRPILLDDEWTEAVFQIDSIYTSWIEDLALYQVSRYTSRAHFGQDDNVVFSKIDLQEDLEVICTPANGQNLSMKNPILRINSIDSSPLSIKGQFDQSRYRQILQNRQMQYLTGSLGDYYSISPQENPDLYSFSLKEDEGGYIFHMELTSPDVYNEQADKADPKRNELEGKSLENFRTDSISIDVFLDGDGAIESMDTLIKNSFTDQNQTYQISEEQQLFLQEAPQQALSSVLTFFKEVENGTLAVGQSFPLKVPVAASQ